MFAPKEQNERNLVIHTFDLKVCNFRFHKTHNDCDAEITPVPVTDDVISVATKEDCQKMISDYVHSISPELHHPTHLSVKINKIYKKEDGVLALEAMHLEDDAHGGGKLNKHHYEWKFTPKSKEEEKPPSDSQKDGKKDEKSAESHHDDGAEQQPTKSS